jgi:periplasmic divalent cation tolerance protein
LTVPDPGPSGRAGTARSENMSDYVQVVTTTESKATAERIAGALVEQRLAACVQIVGPIASVYWWKGRMETSQEWQCIAKTRRSVYERLEAAIRTMHPYETPEIVAIPIVGGSRPYLDWIDAELDPDGR